MVSGADPPNILWLSLESVRADHTSLCGYERDTTPRIRDIAESAGGTALRSGFSQSMWTPAVTASMLTGTYLSTHNVGTDGMAKEPLPSTIQTIPELLGDRYDTALFASNPYVCGTTGVERGFDHTERVSIDWRNYLPTAPAAADYWRASLGHLRDVGVAHPRRVRDELKVGTDTILQRRVARWIESTDRSTPFFAYAHIQSPHHPYYPPEEFLHAFGDDVDMAIEDAYKLVQQVYRGSDELKRRMANGLEFTEREMDGIRALYDALIRYLDSVVGRIVERAERASDRDLVTVIVGDHGELFGEAGILGHNLVLRDGLIRVPMVVRGVEGVEAGPENLTQQIDLSYTIADLAGADTSQFEGRDIREGGRDYAISQRGIAHIDAYKEHNPAFDASRYFPDPVTSFRTTDYKLLMSESRSELYALPDEERDVKADQPEVHDELADRLEAVGVEWTWTGSRGDREFDEDVSKQLADLGYLT
jgi:uncharacterized sulfatase